MPSPRGTGAAPALSVACLGALLLCPILLAGQQASTGRSFADSWLRASAATVSGTARVGIESTVHPEADRIIRATGELTLAVLASAGASVGHREIRWTFDGDAVRLEARIEETGPARDLLYTYDGRVAILYDRGAGTAVVRANGSLEGEIWSFHPRALGQPLFGLGEEDRATLAAALGAAKLEERGGRRLLSLSFRDPWQPLEHRLWVDPDRPQLAVEGETLFAGSEERIRTFAVSSATRLGEEGALALVSREELRFLDAADGLQRFPLVLRTTSVTDLVEGPVEASAFRQTLPPGVLVSNDVFGLSYVTGEERIGEDQVRELADATRGGELPRRGEGEAVGSGDAAVDVRCGVYSLFAAAHLLGLPASLDEVERVTGYQHAGSNVADLLQGAEALGAQARGVRTDLEGLRDSGALGIAHLDGGHFVLIAEVRDDGAVVLDIPSPPRLWPREALEEHWDGVVLLLEARTAEP